MNSHHSERSERTHWPVGHSPLVTQKVHLLLWSCLVALLFLCRLHEGRGLSVISQITKPNRPLETWVWPRACPFHGCFKNSSNQTPGSILLQRAAGRPCGDGVWHLCPGLSGISEKQSGELCPVPNRQLISPAISSLSLASSLASDGQVSRAVKFSSAQVNRDIDFGGRQALPPTHVLAWLLAVPRHHYGIVWFY